MLPTSQTELTHVSQDYKNDGFIRGVLNFNVPGLDEPVDGTFIVVNKTGNYVKERDDFQSVNNHIERQVDKKKQANSKIENAIGDRMAEISGLLADMPENSGWPFFLGL